MNFPDGLILEYRFYRLFLARGLFAERSLHPAVGDGYEKAATDIDVLAIDYGTGFHATRLNVECKSGKNLSKLDRIIWLAGVQRLLNSDISYLVVPEVDTEITNFGKLMKVFTVTPLQLELWEDALKLTRTHWIARSNYELYEPVHKRWSEIQKQEKGTDADWLLFKDISRFLKYDSWLNFSYANLNRLLRLAEEVSKSSKTFVANSDKALCAKYSMGALFVRFCQMLVDLCEQIMAIPPSQLQDHLINRFTFGDNDSRNSKQLIEGTLSWVVAGLKMHGLSLPPELNPERLIAPPKYTKEFVCLIELILSRPAETCALPLTAELLTFESQEIQSHWTEELVRTFQKGQHLAINSKGFFLRAVGASPDILEQIPNALGKSKTNAVEVETSLPPESVQLNLPTIIENVGNGEHNSSNSDPDRGGTNQPSRTGILQISLVSLGTKGQFLSCSDDQGNRLGESVLSPEETLTLIQALGLERVSEDFETTVDPSQKIEIDRLHLQRLSEVERERIAAGWIEWQFMSYAKLKNQTLKAVDWKRLGNKNEFIASINDSRKIVVVSGKQLLDISKSSNARSAFKLRIEETLSGMQRK